MNPAVPGEAIDTLRRVPLFADLDDAELQALAAPMRERTFPAGATVTAEGDPGDGFYVVESGEAEVTVGGVRVGALGPGDWFGEIALLMGAGRAATITATTEFRCHGIAPPEFRTVVEGNPGIAWKLLQSMTQTLS